MDHKDLFLEDSLSDSEQDLPEGVAEFKWELPKKRKRDEESSYVPSGSDESEEEPPKTKVVKATSKGARVHNPDVIIQGCNTTTLKDMKSSTMYCYLNNFHNFWKWLEDNHEETIFFNPPHRGPRTFDELKIYKKCPVIIEKITPEIFFEYIGTNDISMYKPVVSMVKQSLKWIANIFNQDEIYTKWILDIKKNEIQSAVVKKFDRSRFVQPKSTDPLTDTTSYSYSQYVPQRSESDLQNLMYLKATVYNQWAMLEALTPGMVYALPIA